MPGDKRRRVTGKLGMARGERYALIPEEVLTSEAYGALPDFAKIVLFALACRYGGRQNGDVSLPFSEAKHLGIGHQWKLYGGLKLIEMVGLAVCTRRGRLLGGKKLPNLFALTWRHIDRCEGVEFDYGYAPSLIPSNDWAKWKRPENWESMVKQIRRSNHGRSKNPDPTMFGGSRSTTVGAVKPKITQP